MFKVLKEQKGSGLVLVLMVMMLMLVLGTGALATMGSEARQSSRHDNRTQAYYLARSGAEIAHELLKNRDYDINEEIIFSGTLESLQPAADSNKPINVSIKKQGQDIVIKSTGKHNGVIETTGLNIQYTSDTTLTTFEHAVFAANSIEINGQGKIDGSVASDLTTVSQLDLGNMIRITGDLYVPPNSNITKGLVGENVGGEVKKMSKPLTFPLPPFPSFPTLITHPSEKYDINNHDDVTINLNENYRFDKIEISNHGTLNINVGNEDREMIVNSLSVDGQLNIIGSGSLTIYISNSFDFSGRVNSSDKLEQLIIYLKGAPNQIIKSNGGDVYASIYAESADIDLGGNGGTIHGHLITGGKNVTVRGGGKIKATAIYAPKAAVWMTGSGTMKGIVVADTLRMSGGGSLEFGDLSDDTVLEIIIENKDYQFRWE